LVSKLIKKEIREFKKVRDEKTIEEILEKSGSTKRIRKELSTGTKMMTYLTNEKEERVYDRKGINKIATDFYKKLYRQKNTCREIYNPHSLTKVDPFKFEEIKQIISNSKKEKAPGHDKITNKQIKYGGDALAENITNLFNLILKKM
jgi:hypothetical protein